MTDRGGYWITQARLAICEMHDTMPPDATDAEKRKRLAEVGREFRTHSWPYKAFLRARREYLNGGAKSPPPCSRTKLRAYQALPRDPITGRPVIV